MAEMAEFQWRDAWKMCSELSVAQAVLLILGFDPTEFEKTSAYPKNFDAVLKALKDDIEAKWLNAKIVYDSNKFVVWNDYQPNDEELKKAYGIDWEATTVRVADLKTWLLAKDEKPKFFFPSGGDLDPLNKNGKYYAPRLAAAIRAWTAVANDEALVEACGNPKQAIEKWLSNNGKDYGLENEKGEISDFGYEKISSIANWEPAGGRRKGSSQSEPPMKKKAKK